MHGQTFSCFPYFLVFSSSWILPVGVPNNTQSVSFCCCLVFLLPDLLSCFLSHLHCITAGIYLYFNHQSFFHLEYFYIWTTNPIFLSPLYLLLAYIYIWTTNLSFFLFFFLHCICCWHIFIFEPPTFLSFFICVYCWYMHTVWLRHFYVYLEKFLCRFREADWPTRFEY